MIFGEFEILSWLPWDKINMKSHVQTMISFHDFISHVQSPTKSCTNISQSPTYLVSSFYYELIDFSYIRNNNFKKLSPLVQSFFFCNKTIIISIAKHLCNKKRSICMIRAGLEYNGWVQSSLITLNQIYIYFWNTLNIIRTQYPIKTKFVNSQISNSRLHP